MASIIKEAFLLFLLFTLLITARANDGAFYSSGNQLIPIVETDISVQKEVLKINRFNKGNGTYYEVSVYYEFFNPSAAKDLLVGFEASSPSPGLGTESYPNHPCIYDFKVMMNDNMLPYEVAHVPYDISNDGEINWKIGAYYQNGQFHDLTKKQCDALSYNEEYDYYYDYDPFYYVYHFNAHFNTGLNIIRHTYRFDGSGYVMTEYLFDYVLTAANRWANNGIDDFTLEINMGDRESFALRPTFFQDAKEWTINGKGKVTSERMNIYDYSTEAETRPMFHIQEGSIIFHKKNFHPTGEIYLSKPNYYYGEEISDPFLTQYFHLSAFFHDFFVNSDMTAERKRILKNLPFAYRGYVFKSADLQRYFESTHWYLPNPGYQATMEGVSRDEQEWIQLMSK